MFGFLRRKNKTSDNKSSEPAAALSQELQPPDVPPAIRPDALVGGDDRAPTIPGAPIDSAQRSTTGPTGQAFRVSAAQPAIAMATTDAPVPDNAVETSAEGLATDGAERKSWVRRLRGGLSRTRGNLASLFSTSRLDDALYEELETALLSSDAGYEATTAVLEQLKNRVRKQRLDTGEQARLALRDILAELLRPLEQAIDIDRVEPLVIMIAGVNGAGKTTSIGKLARHLQAAGKSILLAAGDTFRAAAREQLAEWGARNNVQVISQQGGDPAAVAFDAVSAAKARGIEIVMVDTAGRLPTQMNLMDELRKIHRVLGKAMAGSPHETLLVLDGNTGQNMLSQVQAFDGAIKLSGLIVTKLDGTAKGGALVALAHQRRDNPVPVYFIGVGEGIADLQAFSADEFAGALLD